MKTLTFLAGTALIVPIHFLSAQQPRFVQAPGSPIPVGTQLADAALGDFNGDGRLDIVVVNSAGRDLSLLLGNGRGGFAPGSPINLNPPMHIVVPADVNKDGNSDLVLTGHDTYGVVVLLGNGKAGLAPAAGSPFQALNAERPHNHGLVVHDMNGDGNLDVATSNHGHNSVSLLLGNGKGGFEASAGSPVNVGRGPYQLAVGDLNGDKHPDLATPNVTDNTVTVLMGDGKGNLSQAAGSPYTVEFRPYYTVIGDVNGDGKQDILTTHDDISKMSILLGDGAGRFKAAPNSPFELGRRGYKVVLADVNRDRKTDLVVCTYPQYLTLLLGDGEGGFKADPALQVGRGPNGVALGDLNGDGKTDIVTPNFESNNVTVLLGK